MFSYSSVFMSGWVGLLLSKLYKTFVNTKCSQLRLFQTSKLIRHVSCWKLAFPPHQHSPSYNQRLSEQLLSACENCKCLCVCHWICLCVCVCLLSFCWSGPVASPAPVPPSDWLVVVRLCKCSSPIGRLCHRCHHCHARFNPFSILLLSPILMNERMNFKFVSFYVRH